ncbi:MAG: M67 family metallopeptidase [Thermaceae bacterium]|nr:M67 family metallopeptidase [Thermaceae bacterium]
MLRISAGLLEQTRTHLRLEAPREGVGLWVGRLGQVDQVIPLPNIHPQPTLAYHAHPGALLQAVQKLDREGLELLAIYHSHPRGPARPSSADQAQAFWRVPYVILALETGEVRAYNLPQGSEVGITVED